MNSISFSHERELDYNPKQVAKNRKKTPKTPSKKIKYPCSEENSKINVFQFFMPTLSAGTQCDAKMLKHQYLQVRVVPLKEEPIEPALSQLLSLIPPPPPDYDIIPATADTFPLRCSLSSAPPLEEVMFMAEK